MAGKKRHPSQCICAETLITNDVGILSIRFCAAERAQMGLQSSGYRFVVVVVVVRQISSQIDLNSIG